MSIDFDWAKTEELKIFAYRDRSYGNIVLHIVQHDPINRQQYIMQAPVFTKRTREDAGSYIEPTLRMEMHNAQYLMDQLWECGLRPSEGTGSAGALAATQAHLNDMKEIAFDLLKRLTK